ncbi:MAG TPA: hypothetical protein VFE14_01680 [Micromonosporaceae bacterium]|nr:hypothetical protein [Micromonosporaceae bacterium]
MPSRSRTCAVRGAFVVLALVFTTGLVGCSKDQPKPVRCQQAASVDSGQQVQIDASAGNPGCQAQITLPGTACPPQYLSSNESVRPVPRIVVVLWDDDPARQLAEATSSNVDQRVTLTFRVPMDATPGAHSIVVACGTPTEQLRSFPFIVIKATLALDPSTGIPGDTVRLTGSGISCTDKIIVEWDKRGAKVGEAPLEKPWGEFALTFTVPADPAPQGGKDLKVEVGVRCSDAPGTRPATQTFTLKGPEQPSLQVRGDKLRGGSPLTLLGRGIDCTQQGLELVPLFDEVERPHAKVVVSSKYQPFEVAITVPPDATPGEHRVNVRCASEQQGRPELAKTVVVQAPAVVAPVVLNVSPDRGWRGRQVTITVSGVDCSAGSPSTVVASVDGAEVGRTTAPVTNTLVAYPFTGTIPAKAKAGQRQVQVRCAGSPAGTTLTAAALRVDVPEVAVKPRTSRPGGQVAISATGFNCAGPGGPGRLLLLWADGTELGHADSSTPDESLTSDGIVPQNARAGVGTLTARCADGSQKATVDVGVAGITVTHPRGCSARRSRWLATASCATRRRSVGTAAR